MNIFHISDGLKIDPNSYIVDKKINYSDLVIEEYYALKIFHGFNFDAYVIKILEKSDNEIIVEKLLNYETEKLVLTNKNNKLFDQDNNLVSIRFFRNDEDDDLMIREDDNLFWEKEKENYKQRNISNIIEIPFDNQTQQIEIENIFSTMRYTIKEKSVEIYFNYSMKFYEMVKKLEAIGIKYNYEFEK